MSLPGFSAEASLQKPRRHYRTVSRGRPATSALSQAVFPQKLCCDRSGCSQCQELLVDDDLLSSSTDGMLHLQIPSDLRLRRP